MSDALSLVLAAVERLQQGFEELRAGQNELRAGLNEVRAGLAEVQTGLSNVQTRQVALSEELRNVRAAIMDRIDRLQDQINQQRDDTLVTYARIERLEKPMREKIDGIEKEISAMYIQIRNLQTEVRLIRGDH